MALVLFCLSVVIFMLVLFFIVTFSTIKINIKKIEIKSIPKLDYDFDVKLGLYLFAKLPVVFFNINKKKIKSIEALKKINTKPSLEIINYFSKLKPRIKSLNLNFKIGIEEAAYNAFAASIISIVISTLLPKVSSPKDYKKISYKIIPMFVGKNFFELSLNSIIHVKMVHIISIIFIILKKRRDGKNERTSNRRAYANSYE